MNSRPQPRYRGSAWAAGGFVFAALGGAVWWMLSATAPGAAAESRAPVARREAGAEAVRPLILPDLMAPAAPETGGELVSGVVLLPDGGVAAGATVTLRRLETSWPEWRCGGEDVSAITDETGHFQFGVPHRHGYLLEFEDEPYAGGVQQVPLLAGEVELRLRPGHSITGTVLNDVGAPVPAARVSIEAVFRDTRRARTVLTEADGSYTFEHLAAGPVRMVAHHESWQPVQAPAVVIGEQADAELRFERPTMPPLRGVVRSAQSGAPVAGAIVELLPPNQNLGLVDPFVATSAADGSFLVEGLPRGNLWMRVRHPGYGAVERTQGIRATANEVAVELPPRTRLRGTLRSRVEGAFAGGEVLQLVDSADELAYATVQRDGTFAFERSVSPGYAEISVVGETFSFRTLTGSAISVRLDEGEEENEVELDVLPAPILRGRFVDEDGAPLTGVSAVSTQRLGDNVRRLSESALALDFGSVGGGIMRMASRDALLAISGEDGAFVLRGAKAGLTLARASGEGFGSRLLRMRMPRPGESRDLGDVVLLRGGRISGRVLRGGRPFVGATVTVTPKDTDWQWLRREDVPSPENILDGARACSSQARTDARGYYVLDGLEEGVYEVRARIPGRVVRSEARAVRVSPDQPARNIDIVIQAGRVVEGVVRNEAGQPLQDALVSVRGRPGEVARSDRDGKFTVELPRRRAELIVAVGDRSLERVVPVRRDQERVEVLVDTPPTCTIAGVVVGVPGRTLLPGVLVRMVPEDAGADVDTVSRWVPTKDGEFERSQVPSGRVRLEFWCDGYAPVVDVYDLTPNEVNQLGEVVLERGSRFRGVVLDDQGAPVEGATVLLGEEADLGLFEPKVRSAADGSFEIEGVTSQSRQLVVRHPAFAARTVQLELPRDLLAFDPVPVELSRGGTIEVVVPLAEIPGTGLVFLRRGGRLITSTVLDERGYAWFANRSPGVYSVKLADEEQRERRVVVKPGDEVQRLLF